MQYYLDLIKNYLFSNYCYICEEQTYSSGLCTKCTQKIKFNNEVCQTCGSYIFIQMQTCFKCPMFKNFDICRSLFETNYDILKIINNIKYYKKLFLIEFFADLIIKKHIDIIKKFDYISYIPMHFNKFISRECNTPQILAYYISKKTNIPIMNTLVKTRNNQSQALIFNKQKRKANVSKVFKIINQELLSNKNILIIDDIRTTGATANAAAKTLKAHVNQIGLITIIAYD